MTLSKFTLAALNDATTKQLNEAEILATNAELDALAAVRDERNATDARIARLTFLNPIEREKEIKATAREFDVPIAAIRQAIKQAEPATDTKGQGRALELPEIEPWPSTVNGAELLAAICKEICRYLVLPNGSAETLALWAVHTHAFRCFEHTPRLALTSPEKRCGKTTTLDVIGKLVARPFFTSNITAPAVFRVVEKTAPTLLIDEADTFLGEQEQLRGILNDGHRRDGQTVRLVGDDHEPRLFSTWSPAAIAMIGRLPDTLADRSVIVRLRRRKPIERVQAFRGDRVTNLQVLARKAARWVTDHRDVLVSADPDVGMLFNRAADNWRPLLAIADAAGGDWPCVARSIAEAAETTKQDQSIKAMLLSDISDIITAQPFRDRISSSELVATLAAIEGRPWAEWGRSRKPMTATALARQLQAFDIVPGTKRDGEATYKGYLYSDFDEAFSIYLADQTVTPSQSNKDGHCDTLPDVTPSCGVTVPKAQKSNGHGRCDFVTPRMEPDPDGWTFNLDGAEP